MLGQFAVALMYLGHIDQAKSRLNEALSEARRLRHSPTLAIVLLFAVVCAHVIEVTTCSPEMQLRAEELLVLSTDHGFAHLCSLATVFRGWSLLALRPAQEGLTLLTKGLSMLRATGAVLGKAQTLILLADADAKLGRQWRG